MNELIEKRTVLVEQMRSLSSGDVMTPEQVEEFDNAKVLVEEIDEQLKVVVEKRNLFEAISKIEVPSVGKVEKLNILKGARGDSEATALKHFLQTRDSSGFGVAGGEVTFNLRSATDSTMNVTTAADGGNLVPTGFAGLVAHRMGESMLADKLGVRRIPGVGTTVNYSVESTDPEVFAATAEQADDHSVAFERNTVGIGSKAFTLAKKTRRIELTDELMEDSPVNIMETIADRIGREVAKTHNALLLAEVASNGTSFKTFAATGAIAAGELEAILGNSTLGFYMGEGANGAWVTNNSTLWAVNSITANARLYGQNMPGLLGYNAYLSGSVAAMGASAKSIYFGNWDYVGLRAAPEVSLVVDPFSVDGLTILKYSFRLAYGVLQAGAVGYGVHAAS